MYKNSKQFALGTLIVLFSIYTIWWLLINLVFIENENLANYFTDSYGIIAGVGGISAFMVAKRWGFLKSIFGRALTMFAIGLFFQFLGQVSYAIYYYVYSIENPYPSFGEIFYFGSIPIVIYGIWLLGKAVGAGHTLTSTPKKVIALVLPLVMMLISYKAFLVNYDFSEVDIITIFLDFGYPLGEAIFVSLALVAYWLSRNQLGGLLKKNVIMVFIALFIQYVADTVFLINTINDTWRPGGLDDYLFLSSYFTASIVLLSFGFAADKLSSTPK